MMIMEFIGENRKQLRAQAGTQRGMDFVSTLRGQSPKFLT
jgi:hypothetical protein